MDTYTPEAERTNKCQRYLKKNRIDECSSVTAGANPYAKVMLMKRDRGEAAALTHEQQLQAAADRYVEKLANRLPRPPATVPSTSSACSPSGTPNLSRPPWPRRTGRTSA
jgi:hypothetical protein